MPENLEIIFMYSRTDLDSPLVKEEDGSLQLIQSAFNRAAPDPGPAFDKLGDLNKKREKKETVKEKY